MLEVEWQFDALYLDGVAAWLRGVSVPGYRVAVGPEKHMSDDYYDTARWHLYRAGYTCRRRRTVDAAELTLKSMAEADRDIRRREEITQPLPASTTVPSSAGEGPVAVLMRRIAGSQPLRPLFTVETHRRTYRLADADGDLGEIALDEAEFPGSVPLQRIRRVEVEVEEDALERALPFVSRLVNDCGLVPAASAKFSAGLHAAGLRPPASPAYGDITVSSGMPAGEVAMAVLRRHFAAFVTHEMGTRLAEDPEPLHQMRVATRRMRAAIRAFGDYLPAGMAHFRDELSWVAGVLGDVRDLDVQIERIPAWADRLDGPEADSLGEYEAFLQAQREVAIEAMRAALDSQRFERLVADFGTALLGHAPPTEPIDEAAPKIIASEYRRVRKLGKRIAHDSPPEDYHRLRVAVKRLRYTVEFVQPVYGKPARRVIKRAVALQDLLGLHQDADVAIDTLRSTATDEGLTFSTEAVLALGMVMGHYRTQMEELAVEFPRCYRALTGKAWERFARKADLST